MALYARGASAERGRRINSGIRHEQEPAPQRRGHGLLGLQRVSPQFDQEHLADACSDEALALTRDICMKSNYRRAVWYVSNEHLQRSCFRPYDEGLPFGPAAYVSKLDARIRLSLDLGQGKDRHFLVFEPGHYAAAIHTNKMWYVFAEQLGISIRS